MMMRKKELTLEQKVIKEANEINRCLQMKRQFTEEDLKIFYDEQIYVEIYIKLLPPILLDMLNTNFRNKHDKSKRIEAMIDLLADHILNVDLSYISAFRLVRGDKTSVLAWLEILNDLAQEKAKSEKREWMFSREVISKLVKKTEEANEKARKREERLKEWMQYDKEIVPEDEKVMMTNKVMRKSKLDGIRNIIKKRAFNKFKQKELWQWELDRAPTEHHTMLLNKIDRDLQQLELEADVGDFSDLLSMQSGNSRISAAVSRKSKK
eukprot:TRINITY_DN9986_c0_g5_i1.p1 TRINITY_DN9986_c0_g5~~TRINITY_DN9986_c0_g5_i1.p1  ORF type:complete len:266 (+),score=50.24 TRINITY_DN9986_c0_g5_i1:64-861(+)